MEEKKIVNKYYDNYKFSKELQSILDSVALTEDDYKKINEAKKNYTGLKRGWIHIVEDLYKLYVKLEYPCNSLSKIFNVCDNTTLRWMQDCGWARNRYEIQAIAVKKRDYAEIKVKRKETMLDRLAENEIFGSAVEQYVRTKLCINLSRLLPQYEVLIGINAVVNIVRREIDIPVIVINQKNKVYRFAVEVDSEYHHSLNEDVEQRKIEDIANSNWFLIKLVNTSTTSSNVKDGGLTNIHKLNEEIKSVIEIIVDEVHSKDKRKKKVEKDIVLN